MSRCHSHVETQYFDTEDLAELGDKQTEFSAKGFDTEVEAEGGNDDEVLRPRRYVITAQRLVCRCRCQKCGHINE